MSGDNKRRHTRIPVRTKVDILFGDDDLLQCETCDLCLTGMRVSSGGLRRPGDQCEITFHRTGITQNRLMRLRGEVVRVDDGGMALLFTDMNYRAYTNLQAILLDNAENPFEVAEEFIDSLPVDQ